jgi:hypothetical protein
MHLGPNISALTFCNEPVTLSTHPPPKDTAQWQLQVPEGQLGQKLSASRLSLVQLSNSSDTDVAPTGIVEDCQRKQRIPTK